MFYKAALIIVDMQVDFCEQGALAVHGTNSLIPQINEFVKKQEAAGNLIVFTRDWHSINNFSFKDNGGMWNHHGVANTKGADFHNALYFPKISVIVNKGVKDDDTGYSAFSNTGLATVLQNFGVKEVTILGVALDYCVFSTAIEGATAGFNVTIIKDLTRSISNNDLVLKALLTKLEQNQVKVI